MSNFKIGFVGATTTEAVSWVAERARGAERICVPFAGSGREIEAVAAPGVTIESWDTQLLSRAVVEGVFSTDKLKTAMGDKPRYKKGHMYQTRGFANIDERCAGFIDYVGSHGTLADKAAIASAAARSTMMGRMDQWDSDINKLWTKFLKAREYLAQFTNLPGTFTHHEANVYDLVPEGPYDAVLIDPPKVVIGSDIYSANFSDLNTALGGKCELPKWSWRDTTGRMRRIFEIDTRLLIFMYVSDVRPTMDDMRKVISEYGTIVEEERFLHRSRYDYGLVVRKS